MTAEPSSETERLVAALAGVTTLPSRITLTRPPAPRATFVQLGTPPPEPATTGTYHYPGPQWRALLLAALRHGWVPQGAFRWRPSDGRDGRFDADDVVEYCRPWRALGAADASALATAAQAAIDDGTLAPTAYAQLVLFVRGAGADRGIVLT